MKSTMQQLWQQLDKSLANIESPKERSAIFYAAAENWLNLSVSDAVIVAESARAAAIQANDDMSMANALNVLAGCYYRSAQPEKAIVTARQALEICSSLDYDEGSATALNTIGAVSIMSGNYKTALESFLESMTLRKLANNLTGVAVCMMNIGNVYYNLGDYALALQYYFDSLELRERINDTVGTGASLGNIGQVYAVTGGYVEALEYLQRSLSVKYETNNRVGIITVLKNIADVYIAMGDPVEAVRFATKCYDCANEQFNRLGESDALYCIGLACEKMGEPADEYFQQSLELRKQLGNRAGESASHCAIGRQSLNRGNYADASEHFFHALDIANKIQSITLAAEAHIALSEVHERTGDIELAFYHYKKWHSLRNRIFNDQSNARVRNLQVVHEVEHTRNQAEVYRLHNIELIELNRSLQLLIQENKEIMGIVSHDLRNPLGSIISLIEILQIYSDRLSLEEKIHYLNSIGQSATRALEIVKKLLDSNTVESMAIELRSDSVNLTHIVSTIIEEYRHSAANKQITIDSSMELSIVTGDADAIGQVVDNLISNAIKYTPCGGSVFIEVFTSGDSASIKVSDDGPGISEEDRPRLFHRFARLSARPTGNEQSIGLGLSIAKKLVERMGGSINYIGGSMRGSTFTVVFPSVISKPKTK